MRLVDKLRQAKAAALDKMDALNGAATERTFTEDEQRAWDGLKAECATLDAQLAVAEERAASLRGDTTAAPIGPNGPGLIAADGTVLRALTKTDKLVDLLPRGAPRESVSIGQVLRGIVHGRWKGMKPLERAVGETGDSVFPVPESISNDWLDMARAASVAFQAGAITIPMRTLTERIVAVTQDPVFTFRKEHKPIPESDIVLGPIDLKAKLCGAIVRTSIELLEDSPIADNLIQQVLINAAAKMLDWALLAGDGSTTGDLDNPTGLLHWPGVPAAGAATPLVNYDAIADAYANVLESNGVPNALIAGTGFAAGAMKIKTGITGDNSILAAPAAIADLPKYYSSVLGTNAVVGDFSMLAWGLRTGTTLEVTRIGGDATFSKAQVLIRLYFRGDTAVLRPTWFSKVTGLPAVTRAPDAPGRQRVAA